MSQPFGGRADFQAYSAWQGMPVTQTLFAYPAGNTYIYTAYLPNFSSLSFIANAAGVAPIVTFEFYPSQSSAFLVSGHTAVIPKNGQINLTVPMQAPYVKIKFTVPAGQTSTVSWTITPSNVPVVRPTHATTQQVISQINVVIPAGGFTVFPAVYTVPGNGHAWFGPLDNSGNLDFALQVYDSTAAFLYNLTYNANVAAAFGYDFLSPMQPVAAFVNNHDAVNARTCSFAVIFQGG